MEQKYLIDTNIFIYYLDGKIPDIQLPLINKIFKESFNISTITKIEILGWHKIDDETKIKIKKFLDNSSFFYIDSIIELKAIEIKQKFKIAIPDAILAATAIINKFTILTRNDKDFKIIPDLRLCNPYN